MNIKYAVLALLLSSTVACADDKPRRCYYPKYWEADGVCYTRQGNAGYRGSSLVLVVPCTPEVLSYIKDQDAVCSNNSNKERDEYLRLKAKFEGAAARGEK